MTTEEILETVKKKIKNISFKTVANGDSLIASGVLDSITTVDLSVALEEHFSIQIPFVDVNEQHFETPEKIAGYIQLKLA